MSPVELYLRLAGATAVPLLPGVLLARGRGLRRSSPGRAPGAAPLPGGPRPGYAFPLWHAFLAAVARIASVEPEQVVRHESSVLVPVAFAVAYEAGYALFRSASAALAVMLASVVPIALAPGGGGPYRVL